MRTAPKLTASMESRSFALSVHVSRFGAPFVESLAVAFVTFSRSDSCTVCSAGKPKAPVFPPAHDGVTATWQHRAHHYIPWHGAFDILPVSAAAITSPPPRMSGTASCWIGVGSNQPISSTARMISGHTPSSSNALMWRGSLFKFLDPWAMTTVGLV